MYHKLKVCYFIYTSSVHGIEISTPHYSKNIRVTQKTIKFLQNDSTVDFLSITANLLLQYVMNSDGFLPPLSSMDLLDNVFKKLLAFSPHVPKCSKTKGIMLGVSPLGRWDCEYFDILFSSCLSTANPSLLAPMSTTC